MARAEWAPRRFVELILLGCTPENAEALRVSMDYGARIGDVLAMKRRAVENGGRWDYREEKTGKRRRVQLSEAHQRALLALAGKVYVFEGRTDWRRHRTRQAVWKDLKRMARACRLDAISVHTARKVYSVERYRESGGNLAKVCRLLNHSDEAVTALYAMADALSRYHSDVRTLALEGEGGGSGCR